MPAPDARGRGLAACVARGTRNARANWPLLVVQAGAGLLLLAILAAGLLPVLAASGVRDWSGMPSGPADWAAWIEERTTGLPGWSGGALVAASSTAVVWLLAFVLFCFFQAGIYGVLFGGDRQAPSRSRGWRFFRTWSFRDFCGWGARDLWRFFRFLILVGAVWLVVAVLALLVAGGSALGSATWGLAAAAGIGCGGLLPVGFLGVSTFLWSGLGQALLPRSEASIGGIAMLALGILGRRLGGVLVLYLLAVFASVAIAGLFMPFHWALNFVLAGRRGLAVPSQMTLTVVEGLASSFVGLTLTASLIALVRGELPRTAAR